jgi:hypothetical protein
MTSGYPPPTARLAAERTSILDLVTEDTRRLEGNLGRADRLKVNEYLYSVREVEKQIQTAERTPHPDDVALEKPSGVPLVFKDYMNLMWDMEILALRTDLTRVVTFMFGREASQRTYAEIGIPDPHHPLTHHAGRQEWIDKVTHINVYHSQLFAGFLAKLKATREGGASLLDRSIIVHGSAISEGNGHSHLNLPTVLAGGGNGRLKHGEHIVYEGGEPMTDLFLSALDCMEVHPESLGDSTGRLGGIVVELRRAG